MSDKTDAGALMERCFNDARSIAGLLDFGPPKDKQEETTKARAQFVKDIALHIYTVEVAKQRDTVEVVHSVNFDLMTFCDLAGLDYTKVVNAMRGRTEKYRGKLFAHLAELKEK